MQDVPKIVLRRLPEATATESHPEANLLTAFAEQSLGDSERVRVMEHLSRCGDCRDVVAFALPATETIAAVAATSPGSGWLRWPVFRWSVVAAGILAVASVGVLQYRNHQQQKTSLVSKLISQERATVVGTQNQSSSSRESESQALTAGNKTGKQEQSGKQNPLHAVSPLSSSRPVTSPTSPNSNFPSPRSRAYSADAIPGSGAAIASGVGSGSGVGQAGKASSAAPEMTPVLTIPQSSQMVEGQSEASQIAENQSDLQVQNRSTADVVKSKDLPAAQAASQGTAAPARSTPASSAAALTAIHAPSWTISANGALQRSFNAGKTWQDVNVVPASIGGSLQKESSADYKPEYAEKKSYKKEMAQPANLVFRAVAAIDDDVWAGASGSVLYHSADSGTHWIQVLPSEASAVLTGDISRIEFSDRQSGRISTSTGETWTTADAGQTWHKQP